MEMESASESPSAWSDVMVVSDDSDLLSDEYINHNHIETQQCSKNTIYSDNYQNIPSTSKGNILSDTSPSPCPNLVDKNISPIEPPAEFRDDSDSTLEIYSNKLSNLVLQDSIHSIAKPCPSKYENVKTHKIIRPRPTRLRSTTTFQSLTNRQCDRSIYSKPIDTIERTSSNNNNNNIVMAHVHEILNDLYSNPSHSSRTSNQDTSNQNNRNNKSNEYSTNNSLTKPTKSQKHLHNSFVINIKKNKKTKNKTINVETGHTKPIRKNKRNNIKLKVKRTLCNLFTFKTAMNGNDKEQSTASESVIVLDVGKASFTERALPPVPSSTGSVEDDQIQSQHHCSKHFASSIEKVKDYGWYWGPISSEAAEKILSTEPDGSFIVRDSSDDHYIFSLTFKLNACVRHVRIEHYQGNFSFGSCTKFKSHTIVDFIENAVEHSRSGRYLFFLHRRPILGPMRVQLLHPVSRFKQVQSLQHMCRFVILRIVRKDHINQLPLPDPLKEYLNTPHYYSEGDHHQQ